MRVGLLTVQVPFVRGGAEMLAESLAREITRSALVGVGLVGLLMAGLAAFAIRCHYAVVYVRGEGNGERQTGSRIVPRMPLPGPKTQERRP